MVKMQLVNIGFGNIIAANKIVAIVSPDSAPIKRMIQEYWCRRNIFINSSCHSLWLYGR